MKAKTKLNWENRKQLKNEKSENENENAKTAKFVTQRKC